MSITVHSALTPEAVRDVAARQQEPAWMLERRLQAWEHYAALPLPEPSVEEWRRTDIRDLRLDEVLPPAWPDGAAGAPRPAQVERLLGAEGRAGLRVQRDAAAVHAALDPALAARGVLFTDLGTALRQAPDLVREHFLAIVRPEGKFRALHAALWSGGTFLYVPPGVEVAAPLVSATWLDVPGALACPHTLVVAGEGSKVTLVDLFASGPMARQTVAASAVEVVARAGAQVGYVAVQEWGAEVWEFGAVRAHLERDAALRSLLVAFGGRLVKTDVESRLQGPGASSEMLGLYFAMGQQHMDFHTLQEHAAPHTLSDLLYKGAVRDRARTVFAGLIRVHPGAQKTNAFQSNRNLILGAGAKSDSIPKLEIMANDLWCTHGSATSRLHEEHLFYLMSRGLSRRQAVQMVVDGFFAEVLDRVPLAGLRDRIQEGIGARVAPPAGSPADGGAGIGA